VNTNYRVLKIRSQEFAVACGVTDTPHLNASFARIRITMRHKASCTRALQPSRISTLWISSAPPPSRTHTIPWILKLYRKIGASSPKFHCLSLFISHIKNTPLQLILWQVTTMSAIFCCSSISPYRPRLLDHEA
jgi:hypothetical protein